MSEGRLARHSFALWVPSLFFYDRLRCSGLRPTISPSLHVHLAATRNPRGLNSTAAAAPYYRIGINGLALALIENASLVSPRLCFSPEMGVVEIAFHPEVLEPTFVRNSGYFSNTLNPHFLPAAVWRWQEHLNPDRRAQWRKDVAADQRAIERKIACEPTFGAITPIVPVEDYWKTELISHRRAALRMQRA